MSESSSKTEQRRVFRSRKNGQGVRGEAGDSEFLPEAPAVSNAIPGETVTPQEGVVAAAAAADPVDGSAAPVPSPTARSTAPTGPEAELPSNAADIGPLQQPGEPWRFHGEAPPAVAPVSPAATAVPAPPAAPAVPAVTGEPVVSVAAGFAQGPAQELVAPAPAPQEEGLASSGSPAPVAPAVALPERFSWARLHWLKSLWRLIDQWVDSAAGYDDKILAQYGTATDEKRRRNIGRAIVVATLVGSLGWFVKVLMAFPGFLAFPVALVIAGLYGVLSYSLESFFASNVNPYATWWNKSLSLLGRSALSAVIAFSGALPWVTMSLKSSVHLEMAKMGLQEQANLRQGVESVHGLGAMEKKTNALQNEALRWTEALSTLPESVKRAMADADACDVAYNQLVEGNDKKAATLNARLPALARMESARDVTPAALRSITAERAQIRSGLAKLAQEVATKKAECAGIREQAEASRVAHIKMATEGQQAAEARLALHRKDEDVATSKVRGEREKMDEVAKASAAENSSGEFNALLNVISTQLYAKFIAGLIFLGLFLVDVLPLTLRLFARPGPYDAEKRTDDSIRMMRAEGRWLEADLMFRARRAEIESEDLYQTVQNDLRPHIRAGLLNKVDRVMAKVGSTS